jgi:hypothetical protein
VFQILAGFDREGRLGGFGAADELAGGDLSPAGEELIFRRSLKCFEKMAEKGFTEGQLVGEFAKADASLVDGVNVPGAVKNMNKPFGLLSLFI